MMRIFDEYGIEKNWAWLEREFGPLVIHPARPGAGWRLVEIHADRDLERNQMQAAPMAAPTIMVKARTADGRPASWPRAAMYFQMARRVLSEARTVRDITAGDDLGNRAT